MLLKIHSSFLSIWSPGIAYRDLCTFLYCHLEKHRIPPLSLPAFSEEFILPKYLPCPFHLCERNTFSLYKNWNNYDKCHSADILVQQSAFSCKWTGISLEMFWFFFFTRSHSGNKGENKHGFIWDKTLVFCPGIWPSIFHHCRFWRKVCVTF